VDRAYHNQQQHTQRLSSRKERRLRQMLMKKLEIHALDNSDEIADMLVDMGVYDDIDPFIPLLRHELTEEVLQAAYSLISLQDVKRWKLQSAYTRILQITYLLRHSILPLLADQRRKERICEGIERVLD